MTLAGPKPAARAKRSAEGTPDAPRRRLRRMSSTDRVVVTLMVAVPTLFVLGLVVLPAGAPVGLSFARWEGIGGVDPMEWFGLTTYKNIFPIYPPFYPALRHNLIWLVFL